GSMGEVPVTEISGLTFTSKNEEGQIREARKKAIEDAKGKASVLAKDLGVRLVRIVNFYESGNYPPIYYKGAMSIGGAEADSGVPTVPTGENKIVSNITITYELGR
ncbi:MAG: SIMPL domain-containing protein, partial [Patescibacteria group bacterium]